MDRIVAPRKNRLTNCDKLKINKRKYRGLASLRAQSMTGGGHVHGRVSCGHEARWSSTLRPSTNEGCDPLLLPPCGSMAKEQNPKSESPEWKLGRAGAGPRFPSPLN